MSVMEIPAWFWLLLGSFTIIAGVIAVFIRRWYLGKGNTYVQSGKAELHYTGDLQNCKVNFLRLHLFFKNDSGYTRTVKEITAKFVCRTKLHDLHFDGYLYDPVIAVSKKTTQYIRFEARLIREPDAALRISIPDISVKFIYSINGRKHVVYIENLLLMQDTGASMKMI